MHRMQYAGFYCHNHGYQFRRPASRALLDRGIGRTLRLVRAHFLEAGLSVGHAGRCSFLHETFGEAAPVTMMFVGFQQKGPHRTAMLIRRRSVSGPLLIVFERNRALPGRPSSSPVGVAEVDKKGVCTLCTLWASDWGVLGADRVGLGMFPGLPSVYKGRNPVRVPPRARITPRQRGFCFNVWTLTLRGSL